MNQRKNPVSLALAYDIGGTKVAVGIVTKTGKILHQERHSAVMDRGKSGLIQQLSELARPLISRYPKVRSVGIASAGPLDPVRGLLLDPTNMMSDGEGWGVVPLVKLLKSRLKLPVYLDNDAAAAVLAEKWLGHARRKQNVMILTLGTGLGVGTLVNGQLARAGRNLHPEASHVSLNFQDKSAPCGCGLYGCAEAYLSGRSFIARYNHQHQSQLSGPEIISAARKKNKAALGAFDEYSLHMAVALQAYVVLYCPELIVFSGGFAEAFPLFRRKTEAHLKKLLARRRKGIDLMPKLSASKLKNNVGLLGGAFLAFQATEH